MPASDDLDWLAHRYLLDELAEEEAAAFEELLGTDEEAAAALSRGTVLLATVTEALRQDRTIEPAVPTVSVPRRPNRLAGLVALAASIALVGLLGVSQVGRQWLDKSESHGTAAELVSIWRESGSEPPADGESLGMDEDSQPVSDDVPDWLMAAVALDVPETDDEILEN
jgi:ferric-dicitrate binding protein FerR (iron transport regulator)